MFIEERIVICFNAEPFLKQQDPIDVSVEGISTYNNDLHSAKALFPIVVIEEGIFICDSFLHPANVPSSIDVIEE